jgi:hypothetical protein
MSSWIDFTAFDGIELSKGAPAADMWGRFGSCEGGVPAYRVYKLLFGR